MKNKLLWQITYSALEYIYEPMRCGSWETIHRYSYIVASSKEEAKKEIPSFIDTCRKEKTFGEIPRKYMETSVKKVNLQKCFPSTVVNQRTQKINMSPNSKYKLVISLVKA